MSRSIRCTVPVILDVIRAVWPNPPKIEESQIIAVELSCIHHASLQDEHGDVLETIPISNKDYTRKDICWAAETFCKDIVPRILRGESIKELRESDERCGRRNRLRQFAPVWCLYLGPQMPCVGVSPEKDICLEFGRHRTRAAQEIGLDVLPMTTYSKADFLRTPYDERLPGLKSYENYIDFLGHSAYP